MSIYDMYNHWNLYFIGNNGSCFGMFVSFRVIFWIFMGSFVFCFCFLFLLSFLFYPFCFFCVCCHILLDCCTFVRIFAIFFLVFLFCYNSIWSHLYQVLRSILHINFFLFTRCILLLVVRIMYYYIQTIEFYF